MPISGKNIRPAFRSECADPTAIYNPFTRQWTVGDRPVTRDEAILAVIDRRQLPPRFTKAA